MSRGHFTYYLAKPKGAIMDNYTAVGIAEGFIEADNVEQFNQAWQHLIDTGLCWTLQGWFGRQAQEFIASGRCTSPETVEQRNKRLHDQTGWAGDRRG